MKLCRFKKREHAICVGLVNDDSTVTNLAAAGIQKLTPLLEADDPVAIVGQLAKLNLPRLPLAEIQLLSPTGWQEVWAAGVTYLRSKTARMEESDFSASAYDKVYAAERPELFFKSAPQKVVATGEAVGIRRDAKWNVPEPELALVMNSKGRIIGHTIGNDMSSRDIEGENLLYLPQAKVYDRSCALGPWIHLGATEAEAREWKIKLAIKRTGQAVFTGETSVGQIKRGFGELAEYLFRSQKFPFGAILLTGTGIVPPDTFTLQEQDSIEIEISGIGLLKNSVAVV
ncbi:MAG TPA: fumarylacetoacetate hydrolase family protein [Verrucomicrobiae bacterium]|nr:fumarylacetoacetate hydrolase family protein [Verrucomicrobiae bacterium]